MGYSQRWTKMFCRDLVEDFADHCNPLRAKVGSWSSPALGTHQSRSTYGLQRKVNNVFGATNKCTRCESIRKGLSAQTRGRKHDRDKPDCEYYQKPFDPKKDRARRTGKKAKPEAQPEPVPAGRIQDAIAESGEEPRQLRIRLPRPKSTAEAPEPQEALNTGGASSSSGAPATAPARVPPRT